MCIIAQLVAAAAAAAAAVVIAAALSTLLCLLLARWRSILGQPLRECLCLCSGGPLLDASNQEEVD